MGNCEGRCGESQGGEQKEESLTCVSPTKEAQSVDYETTKMTGAHASPKDLAVQGQWLQPGAHHDMAGSPVKATMLGRQGDTIFALGGMGLEGGVKCQLASVERFDYSQQQWIPQAPMTTRRLGAGAAYLPNIGLLACGGFDGRSHLDSVELLSVATGKWEMMPPMPGWRTFAGLAQLGGKVYVAGGLTGKADMTWTSKDLHCYDPKAKKWEQLQPMKAARLGPGVAALNGYLFVVGGADESGAVLKSVEIYKPEEGCWIEAPDMVSGRGAPGVAAVKDCLWVIGGCNDEGQPMDTVEGLVHSQQQVVCAESSTIKEEDRLEWKVGPSMPTARAGLGCCVVGDSVCAIGGCGNGSHYLSTVEWLNPGATEWVTANVMTAGRRYPAVAVVGSNP